MSASLSDVAAFQAKVGVPWFALVYFRSMKAVTLFAQVDRVERALKAKVESGKLKFRCVAKLQHLRERAIMAPPFLVLLRLWIHGRSHTSC